MRPNIDPKLLIRFVLLTLTFMGVFSLFGAQLFSSAKQPISTLQDYNPVSYLDKTKEIEFETPDEEVLGEETESQTVEQIGSVVEYAEVKPTYTLSLEPATVTPPSASEQEPSPEPHPGTSAVLTGEGVNLLLSLVNQERSKAGVSPLVRSSTATRMSEDFALELALNSNGLYHSNFQPQLNAFGVMPPATVAAENLGFRSANDPHYIVSEWAESVVHKDNMLNPTYTKAGIGIAENNGNYYYVMVLSD